MFRNSTLDGCLKIALRTPKAILLDRSSFSLIGIRERGRALLDLDARESVGL